MSDQVTETTTQGYFDRIGESIGNICIGILLFFGSFPLLFWNEGRAVERYETIREAEGLTMSLASVAEIDPANEGKLVHFTTELSSDGGTLVDPIFGVESTDLKLRRDVSMYQWTESKSSETKTSTGGKKTTTTTYSYDTSWRSSLVDSSAFKEVGGHENPTSLPFDDMLYLADTIFAGAFKLPVDLTSRVTWWEDVEGLNKSDIVDSAVKAEASPIPGGYFIGNGTSNDPDVGDVRALFKVVKPAVVSVIAEQEGDSLVAYEAEAGGTILILQKGNFTAAEMFDQEEDSNKFFTWLLRFGGFAAMTVGIYLTFNPLEVLADVLPIFGDIVGCGIWFIALLVASIMSTITICLAWLYHHPVIALTILGSIVGVTVLIAWAYKHFTSKDKKVDNSEIPGEASRLV